MVTNIIKTNTSAMHFYSVFVGIVWCLAGSVAIAEPYQDLFEISLEQLLELEIADVMTQAEKREAFSQSVPFSLSIITPATHYSPLFNTIGDLDERTSGLVVTEYNKTTPQLFIRGIGSNASGSGDDPSVAYLMDGISVSRPGYHNLPLFDVKRTEVIKGPHGTLYGKGVIGGAVNVVPNKPEASDYSKLIAGVNDRGWELQSITNSQISSETAHRLSIAYSDTVGYVENVTTGVDTGASRELSIRDQWVWKGGDQQVGLRLEYSRLASIDPAHVYEGEAPYAAVGGAALTPYANTRDHVAMPEDGFANRDFYFASLSYEHESSYGKWVSQTAYIAGDYEFELSATPINYIPSSNPGEEKSWQLSEELRLEQEQGDWQWSSGVYLSREHVQRLERFDITGLVHLAGYGGLLTEASPGYGQYDSSNDVYNGALFVQARWAFMPDWNLSAGVRGDYVKKDFAIEVSGGDPLNLTLNNSEDFSVDTDKSWRQLSYSLGLDHHVAEDVMFYGQVATGFKAGSFNSVAFSPQAALASSKPECAVNTELGMKAFFFDRTLKLNGAVFHTDYENLQVFAGIESEANAPEAEIQGAELEFQFRVLKGLEFTGNYTYLDTAFNSFISPENGDNLSGNNLLRAPRHAVALNLNYSWVGRTQNRYWVEWSSSYTSEFYNSPQNDRGTWMPGHHLTNLALYLQPAGTEHLMFIWVRNALDEQYPVHSFDQARLLFTPQGSAWNMAEPRTIGITMDWAL